MDEAMTDSGFRTPAEQAAHTAVRAELQARIPSAVGEVPHDDRGSGVRENAALGVFDEPVSAASAVVVDAMIKAGTVGDDHYARLLTLADRRSSDPLDSTRGGVTRAVAFDAFGTLVRIGRKRHPFERLIRQARDRARALPSPMAHPIGLADCATLLGLPSPHAELAMLEEELASIALFPDALDALRRVRDRGVKVAVASNLAMPYAAPLKALLGDLVDVWHFSFEIGSIKPERAFYAALTTKLACAPDDLLMVGDTWRDDIVGAVEAGIPARWLDRAGRASHARRFVAVRSLDQVMASPDRSAPAPD